MASLNERLVKAAAEGKVDEIAALLDQGASIDFVDDSYHTPLIKAIECMNEAAALYLINRGANVALTDSRGDTALHWACRVGLEEVARALLKRGADVEAKGWNGRQPLHQAAQGGHEDIMRLLITKHGALINARDSSGTNPLLLALEERNESVASLLLSAGADRSVVDRYGWATLHHACRGGLASIVARLLDEFGLDLHAKTSLGESCLHLAALGGHVETCRLLLERGILVDEVDEEGQSPLACAYEYPPILELLLDHGADIERRDKNGYTPLDMALRSSFEESIILLVERGARLDAPMPRHSPFASMDEGLARTLEGGFLETLFTEPVTPIPPYRRALRWALASPAVDALVQENGWSLLGTAKTDEEVEEMIKKRLGLIEDEAWERRKHLVIDRALDWGYGDSGKAPVLK